jgi:hypothetical protein
MLSEPRIVRSLEDIQVELRAIAETRGMTRLTIDELAGLASGHAAKLLGPIPAKRLGPETLPRLLRALALRLVLEDDPERLAEIAEHLHGRSEGHANAYAGSRKLKTLSYVNKLAARMVKRDRRKWALLANKQRMAALSPEHRTRIAKIASRAFWKKYRALRKAARAAEVPSHEPPG